MFPSFFQRNQLAHLSTSPPLPLNPYTHPFRWLFLAAQKAENSPSGLTGAKTARRNLRPFKGAEELWRGDILGPLVQERWLPEQGGTQQFL